MRRRIGVLWGLAAGLAVAAAAHAVYWYAARERGGLPSVAARALLLDPAWGEAAWIAYPHQNLGRLERRVGDLRAWLALLRGGGISGADDVPSFGPFVVPPASEMVVAQRRATGEVRAMVRVYPTVRLVARAAGRLAGNPWLGGGEVDLGRRGRAVVAWRDGCWTIASARAAVAEPAALDLPEGAPRALIRMTAPPAPLPAGLYRLVRIADGLELRQGPPLDEEPLRLDGGDPPVAAWAVEVAERAQLRALVLWEEEGVLPGFPSAATLARGGRPRPLPGVELLRVAGRRPERRRAAGFEIRAATAGEAERAASLAPALAAAVAERPDLRLAAGADVAAMGRLTRRLAERFAALPIARLAGFDPGRIAAALAAAERCGVSRLELRDAPQRLRWRLCPPPEAPASR